MPRIVSVVALAAILSISLVGAQSSPRSSDDAHRHGGAADDPLAARVREAVARLVGVEYITPAPVWDAQSQDARIQR
jgi:hypothetical protein